MRSSEAMNFYSQLDPHYRIRGDRLLSLIPPAPQPETNFATDHHCGFWALGGD